MLCTCITFVYCTVQHKGYTSTHVLYNPYMSTLRVYKAHAHKHIQWDYGGYNTIAQFDGPTTCTQSCSLLMNQNHINLSGNNKSKACN